MALVASQMCLWLSVAGPFLRTGMCSRLTHLSSSACGSTACLRWACSEVVHPFLLALCCCTAV